MKAFAPNGSQILGTLERLTGRAEIVLDTFEKNPDGTLDFDWDGGTEIFYDDQETVTIAPMGGGEPERVFLAEDGNEWTESEIILKEDDEETA